MEHGMNAVATIIDARDRRGYDDYRRDCGLEEVIADGVQRLQHDVPESTASIKDSIQAARDGAAEDAKHIVDILCQGEKAIMHKISDNLAATKDAETRLGDKVMGNRFELSQVQSKLIERLDYETDIVKERLNGFERSVDKQFCEVKENIKDSERRILDRLTSDKLDEKNNIIDELRHERRQSELIFSQKEQQLAFSNQLNLINSMLNDLSQNQKFNSKVVQFGAGNLAGTAQTANQG